MCLKGKEGEDVLIIFYNGKLHSGAAQKLRPLYAYKRLIADQRDRCQTNHLNKYHFLRYLHLEIYLLAAKFFYMRAQPFIYIKNRFNWDPKFVNL